MQSSEGCEGAREACKQMISRELGVPLEEDKIS